jgi:hypothetical protein
MIGSRYGSDQQCHAYPTVKTLLCMLDTSLACPYTTFSRPAFDEAPSRLLGFKASRFRRTVKEWETKRRRIPRMRTCRR